MTYQELREIFRAHESTKPDTHLTGYITFSGFGPYNPHTYTNRERTYAISSNNKAFQLDKGGYSIFGSCLEGPDRCLRLEAFMRDERGGKDGWTVGECCILGYVLTRSHGCTMQTLQCLYSAKEAKSAMLRDLRNMTGYAYEAKNEETGCGYDSNTACGLAADDDFDVWMQAPDKQVLHWHIEPARIYSPTHIVFGDIEDEARNGATV